MAYVLTGSDDTIVTTGASTNYLSMIHRARRQRSKGLRWHAMAGIAGIGTVYVSTTLARRDYSVMTFRTGTDDLGMIHVRCSYRHPGSRKLLMTGIAEIR